MPIAKKTKEVVKKAVKKVAKEITVKKATPPVTDKPFKVVLKYNDEVKEIDTDDVQTAIRDLEVKYIKTNLKVAVTYKGKTVERMIGRQAALRMFRNNMAAMSFAKGIKLALNATE
jgi:hypothetical protein